MPTSAPKLAAAHRIRRIAELFAMTLVIAAAQPAVAAPVQSLAEQLRIVAAKRIYFGHQSVGTNILDGLQDLATDEGVPLRITKAESPSTFDGPAIVHAFVGENTKPVSKIEAFERAMESGWAEPADVAFFKFCYVDIDAATDIRALFDRYVAMHAQVAARHPEVSLVHVTVPLTVTQAGLKGWVKKLMGRVVWGERENQKRHEFNELLRARFTGKEPIFDLARAESTFVDGNESRFELDGRAWPSLVPAYTDDGEHLNAAGRKQVARALVETLASIP
jgi:hypothetical protein